VLPPTVGDTFRDNTALGKEAVKSGRIERGRDPPVTTMNQSAAWQSQMNIGQKLMNAFDWRKMLRRSKSATVI
jgi:hypothetical protein